MTSEGKHDTNKLTLTSSKLCSTFCSLVLCDKYGCLSQTKSRKYRRIIKVKSREKTRQVQKNWFQQLKHKHVPKRD